MNKKYYIYIFSILLIAGLSIYGYFEYHKDENIDLYPYNLSKRKEIQSVSCIYLDTVIDKEGHAYITSLMDLESIKDDSIRNNLSKIMSTFKEYSVNDYLPYFMGYKLNYEKVLSSYYLRMGLDSDEYFFFLYDDGKVFYINITESLDLGSIVVKNIDNINKVISIVDNTYGLNPYFITSNGNELSIIDYLKNS